MTEASARALINAYRVACTRASVDPATGPTSEFEAVRAIAASRKHTPTQWQRPRWGAPGQCRSPVEYEALANIDHEARLWRSAQRISHIYVAPLSPVLRLRDYLHQRGRSISVIKLSQGDPR